MGNAQAQAFSLCPHARRPSQRGKPTSFELNPTGCSRACVLRWAIQPESLNARSASYLPPAGAAPAGGAPAAGAGAPAPAPRPPPPPPVVGTG